MRAPEGSGGCSHCDGSGDCEGAWGVQRLCSDCEGLGGCSHCEGLGGCSDCEGHLGRCSDCEGLGRCSDWKAWGAAATVRGNLLGLQGAREAAATAKAWGRRGAWVQREGCRDCEAACRFTARD